MISANLSQEIKEDGIAIGEAAAYHWLVTDIRISIY